MDSELQKYYLDKNNFTDEQIEEEREKKYRYYRDKLLDFRSILGLSIDDVQFETIVENLLGGYLMYRMVDSVNSYRLLHKGFKPYLDEDGNIKSEFSTEKYNDRLRHDEDELISDEEE